MVSKFTSSLGPSKHVNNTTHVHTYIQNNTGSSDTHRQTQLTQKHIHKHSYLTSTIFLLFLFCLFFSVRLLSVLRGHSFFYHFGTTGTIFITSLV